MRKIEVDWEPLEGMYEACVPSGEHDGEVITMEYRRDHNGCVEIENVRTKSGTPFELRNEFYWRLKDWILEL